MAEEDVTLVPYPTLFTGMKEVIAEEQEVEAVRLNWKGVYGEANTLRMMAEARKRRRDLKQPMLVACRAVEAEYKERVEDGDVNPFSGWAGSRS